MLSPPVSTGILGPRFKTGHGTKDTPEMWACYADVEHDVSILIEHVRKNEMDSEHFQLRPCLRVFM